MRFGKRTIVLLCIVAAVLIAAVAVIWNVSVEPVQKSEQYIFGSDKTSISSVTVKNSYGSYTITDNSGKLSVTGVDSAELNSGQVKKVMSTLTALKSTAVSDAGSKVKTDPTVTATVKMADGSETKLYIGKKALESDGYYAWTDKSETVYVIASYIHDMLIEKVDSLMDLQVIDFLYEEDYDDLESMDIKGSDMLEMSFEKYEDGLLMTLPVKHTCFQRDLKMNLLDGIMHMTADSYVGTEATPEMGFDKPVYTITMKYKGSDFKLLFGNLISKSRYVENTKTGNIYTVPESSILFNSVDYRSAIGSVLYYRDIKEVKSFAVVIDGKKYDISISETGDGSAPYEGSMNGQKISYSKLMAVYNPLIEFELKQRLTEEKISQQKQDDKTITAELTLKDGRVDRIELDYLSEREYGFKINDMEAFSTPAEDVEKLIDAAGDLAQ